MRLFSLTWRWLLVVALVANPVAAAAMACAMDGAEPVAAVAAPDASHCDMAGMSGMSGEATPAKSQAQHAGHDAMDPPAPGHGCDCGDLVCQFAACAAFSVAAPPTQALDVATVPAMDRPAGASDHGAGPPPLARTLRPPIA